MIAHFQKKGIDYAPFSHDDNKFWSFKPLFTKAETIQHYFITKSKKNLKKYKNFPAFFPISISMIVFPLQIKH